MAENTLYFGNLKIVRDNIRETCGENSVKELFVSWRYSPQ